MYRHLAKVDVEGSRLAMKRFAALPRSGA
jgi:hypothetical protein